MNPIWLIGSAGILVPVIIHLWNIRKGKTMRIGSTLLISAAAQKSASSLRISQWLLLLLRCLMIIAIAMLLAGPEWRVKNTSAKKGWVLMDAKHLNTAYQHSKTTIDSLLSQGFEAHLTNHDFDKLSLKDGVFTRQNEEEAKSGSHRDSAGINGESYWSMFNRLDRQLPARYPVWFFSGDRLADAMTYKGEQRPRVSIDLRWIMTPATVDSAPIAVWAHKTPDNNLEKISIVSTPSGNHYLRETTSKLDYTGPTSIDSTGAAATGNPKISTARGRFAIDTATITISVYVKQFAADAKYLVAALKAIATFGKLRLDIKTITEPNSLPAKQDWLFWLAIEPVPAAIVARNIFSYEPGKVIQTNTWLVENDNAASANNKIRFYQVIESQANRGLRELIWKDGFGNPLLTRERATGNTSTWYRFYSRLNPGWNDLTWSAGFPAMLLPAVIDDPLKDKHGLIDNRRTETADVIPTVLENTFKENKSAFKAVELTRLAWLIIFVLFAAERLIATTGRKKQEA